TTVARVRSAPSPLVRRSLRWTEIDRRRAATSSHAGASPARSSIQVIAAKVLSEARRLAKSEAQGQFLLAAPIPRLSEWLGPGLPNRRREFDSRTVVSATSGRRCPTVRPARTLFFAEPWEGSAPPAMVRGGQSPPAPHAILRLVRAPRPGVRRPWYGRRGRSDSDGELSARIFQGSFKAEAPAC